MDVISSTIAEHGILQPTRHSWMQCPVEGIPFSMPVSIAGFFSFHLTAKKTPLVKLQNAI